MTPSTPAVRPEASNERSRGFIAGHCLSHVPGRLRHIEQAATRSSATLPAMHSSIRTVCLTGLLVLAIAPALSRPAHAQATAAKSIFSEEGPVDTTWTAQLESLGHSLIRLPLAALLSAMLAFRPRRKGTP